MSMLWIGISGLVIGLAATAMSTISAYQQGRAQEQMYQAQADASARKAEMERKAAEQEAELIQDQAAAESKKLRREHLRFAAQQKTAMAAMGISGVTAEDIIADTTKIENEDKSTLRYNADTASWEAIATGNYAAWQSEVDSTLNFAAARNTRKATSWGLASGITSMASDAVGGFGKIKSSVGNFKQNVNYGGGKITGKTSQGYNIIGYR